MVPTKQVKSETQALDTFVRDLKLKLNQTIVDYIFLLDFYKAIPPEASRKTSVAATYWSFGRIAVIAIFILGLILRIMTANKIVTINDVVLYENKMPLQIRKIGGMVENSIAIIFVSSMFLFAFRPRILHKIIDICHLSFQDALTEIKAKINNLLFEIYFRRSPISIVQNDENNPRLILKVIDAKWHEEFKENNALNSSNYSEINGIRKTHYFNHPDFNRFTRVDIYDHYSSQLLTLEIVLKEVITNFISHSALNKEILSTLEKIVDKIIDDIENYYRSSELNFGNFQDPISYQHELVATRFSCRDTHNRQHELPSNLTSDLRTVEGLAHFSIFKHWKSNLNCKIADTKIDFTQVDLLFNATKRTSTIAMGDLLGMPKEEIELYCQENFRVA